MKIKPSTIIVNGSRITYDRKEYETIEEALQHLGDKKVLEMINYSSQLKQRDVVYRDYNKDQRKMREAKHDR